jgi:hypothetical protein
VRALATVRDGKVLRAVDYKNLGAEELGSVYESLLELHPEIDADAGTFVLRVAAGSERKTTGSYYTPTSLIGELLDSALDPVLEEAAASGEKAILDLKVVDPACGSGHFLVAAAHRIAKRLASVRTGDEEPSPEATRHALRDVVSRCIYGVDVNPMAVELCKVSLWMEALEPGKPLSFLDAHIRSGNSLLGTTPDLIAAGIPDDAFKAIGGDDKEVANELRRRNKQEREGQLTLEDEVAELESSLAESAAALEQAPDDSLAAVREKARLFSAFEESHEHRRAKLLADAWSAAFLQLKTRDAPAHVTQAVTRRLADDPARVPDGTLREIERLADQYRLFHWHVEFPTVFADPNGGFDCLLGNPPWGQMEIAEKEFFAETHPEIANARNKAARVRLIEELARDDRDIYFAFRRAVRRADGERHLIRSSGLYPLCGRGRINSFAVFAEAMRSLVAPTGRVGCIVPSAIATDDTTQLFFADLVASRSLASLFEFENVGFFTGAGQGHMLRFCLLTLVGRARSTQNIELMFQGQDVSELADPERHFTLTPADFALLNPNTHTCPIFRTRRDAQLTKYVYGRVPVLVNESRTGGNPWGVEFRQGLFNMATDSRRFRVEEELQAEGGHLHGNVFRHDEEVYLPLYESKMVYQYAHRFADYTGSRAGEDLHRLPELPLARLSDPEELCRPRYWVSGRAVQEALAAKERRWFIGWRLITDARASARTLVAMVLPRVGVGNSIGLVFSSTTPTELSLLLANFNAFATDYCVRQKLGGTNLSFYVMRQIPIVPPALSTTPAAWSNGASLGDWITPRVLELTYTAVDLAPFAHDVGWNGPPFCWRAERRFVLRCELDAAFFHLYGLAREDVDYVMDTFPIVRDRDVKAQGEYRTKRVILEIYDELAQAIESGKPHATRLDPPPADARVAHPSRAEAGAASAAVAR